MTFKDTKNEDDSFSSRLYGKKEEQKQETVQTEKKGEGQKKQETKKGVKESDFNKVNFNKVGIRGANDTNAIDTIEMSVANIPAGGELKIDLAEEYENIKALKIKFQSASKFKVNDSDQEFESKAPKNEAEIFELDESVDGKSVSIKPTGDNGAQIVDVQVFVEGDPNKRKNHDDRNPPAPKAATKKGNGDKK